jgi:hypothetical protein
LRYNKQAYQFGKLSWQVEAALMRLPDMAGSRVMEIGGFWARIFVCSRKMLHDAAVANFQPDSAGGMRHVDELP